MVKTISNPAATKRRNIKCSKTHNGSFPRVNVIMNEKKNHPLGLDSKKAVGLHHQHAFYFGNLT